jgi:serine/threonine protein kinase
MGREVRCPNPACGRPSTLGNDPLGRVFRCPHCRTKLSARSWGEAVSRSAPPEVAAGDTSGITMIAGLAIDSHSWDDVISSPGESSTAAAPSRLGRFWVLEPLGSGTFATVYRAVDPELQRDVALKVPHEGLLTEPRVVDRFLDEARALAQLRHPRIVPIYEVGSDGACYFFVMALIEGQGLDAVIRRGPPPHRRAARIACDLADALAYAHEHGIVHRDVKPANILIDHQGRANLMDFGLARRQGSVGPGSPDRTGSIVGTPAYLAPEQAHGVANDVLPAADQYSLGVVLYELLCGRPPFIGPPPLVLSHAIQRKPPRPRSMNPEVPPTLEALCLKAMAKRPEERFTSCRALADELRRWLIGTPARRRTRTSRILPPETESPRGATFAGPDSRTEPSMASRVSVRAAVAAKVVSCFQR